MFIPRQFLAKQASSIFTAAFPMLFLILLLVPVFSAKAEKFQCWCARSGKCASDQVEDYRLTPKFVEANLDVAIIVCGSGKCPPPAYSSTSGFTEHCPARTVTAPAEPVEEAAPT